MSQKILSQLCTVALFTLLLIGHQDYDAGAAMRNINKRIAGVPPYTIMQEIFKANNSSVRSLNLLQKSSSPLITWLTDPDARIQPHMILSPPDGRMFICRNFGAQLEGASGPVEYGVRHLHTPILLITSDSDNRAISMFMEGYHDSAPSVKRELDHLSLPLAADNPKGPFAERLIRNIEANIDYQVSVAVERYTDRINLGRLTVIGTILDFTNVYKRGEGRLIIININGETRDQTLKNLPIMTSISPEVRNISIGRQRPKAKEESKTTTK